MRKICYNGIYYNEQEPVLKAGNKSYRYGDGFFETMKIWKGKILLASYHKERIAKSMARLKFLLPAGVDTHFLFTQITALCGQNNCLDAARVRLSFSNGEGSLFDNNNQLHYLIEAWPLDEHINGPNENGLTTGLFTAIKKSCDEFASIKSASALIYSVAARYSIENNWDDCILLNQENRVCESSIANIFWIKENRIFTPPLTEGCVDGVTRAYLMDTIGTVTEIPCLQKDLLEADEVFLTNAIRGISPVKTFGNRNYSNIIITELFREYIQPLY
ncbi:MAG TPA: aminotransferase class IV [Niabella sp.]|nr:aminotransferase class IV [Niabella sp.]